jgi:hypothetical protein
VSVPLLRRLRKVWPRARRDDGRHDLRALGAGRVSRRAPRAAAAGTASRRVLLLLLERREQARRVATGRDERAQLRFGQLLRRQWQDVVLRLEVVAFR